MRLRANWYSRWVIHTQESVEYVFIIIVCVYKVGIAYDASKETTCHWLVYHSLSYRNNAEFVMVEK